MLRTRLLSLGMVMGLGFLLMVSLVFSAALSALGKLPRVRVAWRDVGVGALITALLFTLGKSLIGLYIGRSGVASSFGAAASLVVLRVWVYWSAQIFLLGAEFTWVWANRRGSRRGEHADGPLPPARLVGQSPPPAA